MYTEGIEACLAQKDGKGGSAGEALDVSAIAALYGNRAASHVMILEYEQVGRGRETGAGGGGGETRLVNVLMS